MRHRKRGRKLGRNSAHRAALMRSLMIAIVRSTQPREGENQESVALGRIVTTSAKAKELRPHIERLVTLAKRGLEFERQAAGGGEEATSAAARAIDVRRRVFAVLRDNSVVAALYDVVRERFVNRNGGYTRVIRLATPRLGDAGERAFIEFVGTNDRRTRAKKKGARLGTETPAKAESAQ